MSVRRDRSSPHSTRGRCRGRAAAPRAAELHRGIRVRCRRLAGSRGCRDRLVDMRALPQLEHHECPEAVAVVGPARRVLVEKPLDGRRAKPAARARRLTEQEVACKRLQLTAEPGRERNAEAALATVRDARRQIIGERAAQCDLALATASLQMVGQCEAELYDAMIEEWRAQLE